MNCAGALRIFVGEVVFVGISYSEKTKKCFCMIEKGEKLTKFVIELKRLVL